MCSVLMFHIVTLIYLLLIGGAIAAGIAVPLGVIIIVIIIIAGVYYYMRKKKNR